MGVYTKEVTYRDQKITVKCTESKEQDRCFDCPVKYDMFSTIDLSLHALENKSIKETELERYLNIHVDTAKNVIDKHTDRLSKKESVPEALETLGFELDNTK